ncbi:metal-dependent hydrolase family protein [Hirschia maritima]|uniref:metal-dependent hydrolase family protein n=1 Tax=Hirschia maritima TaxID=1121961 RepID=UPI00037B4DE4|nr:amidohydrolase family protein [Hirschia maritima]
MGNKLKSLCCATALATITAPSAFAEKVIIHAGTLLVEPAKEPLLEYSIIVEDDKITAVQKGYIKASKGTKVIDLKDHTVLPGLIDCHVHMLDERGPGFASRRLYDSEVDQALLGVERSKRTLDAGFTTVQDLGGTNEAIFSLRDAINAGTVAGPRILAAGQIISATGGHGDVGGLAPKVSRLFETRALCDGADDCRRAVREQVKRGADVIKITATGGVLSNTSAGLEQQFFDDELKAIMDTAATMGRRVTAHAHGKGGVEAALRAGVNSIEHGTYLDEETIKLFKENDATLVPTVLAGMTVVEWSKEDWMTPATKAKAKIVGPLMLDMLKRAKEGGVNVAFGTDSGVSRHGENARELGYMVEAGFSPAEALQAATVNSAKNLNLFDDIGTLSKGKYADIIAVDGDPLKNIDEMLDVDFVMKSGKVHKSPET